MPPLPLLWFIAIGLTLFAAVLADVLCRVI